MPKVDKKKCIGCSACINACPVGAISLRNGKAVIDKKKCISCLACVASCPQNAIQQ